MIGFGSNMMGGGSGLGMSFGIFGILGSILNILIWIAVFAIVYKLLTGHGAGEQNTRLTSIENDIATTKKTLEDIVRKLNEI